MKYDFDLDMVSNNSLSLIARRIKKNSKVLEFGPAHGRLTKYLKESLGCEVYIVEIDKVAALEAEKFSKASVVGDIEDYKWLDVYMDMEFDFIIFADVLEHLRNPKKVLQEAKKLLQYDGSIVLSVPNIAHNAVIVDLLNNKFEYREVGLLDNTHINFFTIHSLEKMLNECYLFIINKYSTYAELGETEFNNNYNMVEGVDFSFWKERDYGTSYQFIYEVKKSQELVQKCNNYITKNIKKYLFKIYFDFGNGFNEEECYTEFISSKENCHEINVNIDYENKIVNKFRIDFLDKKCCIKVNQILAVLDDGSEIELQVDGSNENVVVDGKYYFNHDDPQIIINNDNNYFIKKIVLCFSIYLSESSELDFIVSEILGLMGLVKDKDLRIDELVKDKDFKINDLDNEKEEKNLRINELINEKEENNLIINDLMREKEEKDLTINNLIKEKEEILILEMTRKVEFEKEKTDYELLQISFNQKEKEIQKIYNSKRWKIISIINNFK